MGGILLHQIQLPLAAFQHGVVGDLAPLVVAGPGDDLAVDCAGQVIRSTQIITVVIGVQLTGVIQQAGGAVLNALDHNAQTSLVAVHIAVIQAVHLMLHQRLVGFGAEVHHELLDHRAGLLHVAAGGLVLIPVAVTAVAIIAIAVVSVGHQRSGQGIGSDRRGLGGIHIVISIAVLGDDPGLLHQSAQIVVGVDALLSVAVDTPDHLIGLVIGVRAGSGDLLVLDVLLQNQVAPLVVGAGSVGLPVVGGAVDLLVQVVVDVIAVMAANARLIGQIAQTVIGVGAGGVAVVVMGGDEPVQRVIGVKGLVLGLARAVAPHILIGHVAVGIIRISMLLGLSGLLAGMGVVHRQKAAHLVIGIILHPAVGIPHLRDTAHAVVGVRSLAAVGLRHLRLVMDQVIVIGGGGAVRIGDGGLVAHAVVGVLYPLAGVIRGSGQLMQQVQLKGSRAQSVGHGDQIAGLVVPVRDFLSIIVVNLCY